MHGRIEHTVSPERFFVRAGAEVFLVGARGFAAALRLQDSGASDEPRPVRRHAASRNGARPESFGGCDAQRPTWLDRRAVLGVLARTFATGHRQGDTGDTSSEIVRCRSILRPRSQLMACTI